MGDENDRPELRSTSLPSKADTQPTPQETTAIPTEEQLREELDAGEPGAPGTGLPEGYGEVAPGPES